VTIRKARPEDAALLTNLAFRSKASWGYDREFMEACRAELTYGQADIECMHVTVLEIERRVLGFYALQPSSPGAVELDALFVDPSVIGQGYGRALIEHAKTMARAMHARVMVVQGDPHAERFYVAAGGSPAGTRESASIPDRQLPMFHFALR
jgi:GNAT superfamily N-acetyltransferase